MHRVFMVERSTLIRYLRLLKTYTGFILNFESGFKYICRIPYYSLQNILPKKTLFMKNPDSSL